MGEDLSDLQYIDARIVSRIKAFVLVGQQFSDTPVFIQRGAITRFYKALCRVQELCLLSNPYPLTDVDQLICLKNLQIDLSVDEFPYLHGAIQQLPRLGVLDIVFKKHWSARKYPYTLLPGENTPAIENAVPSTYRHGTNIIDASDLPPISTSLYYVSIAHSGPEMFHRACILIRSLPNLTKVAVHESNALDILEFNRIRGRGVKTEVYG
ncbi:hypothetical protein DL89DRAFT_269824 [Linderina pennispora]|uniref:F-box domain-containing protein n=1 Tax=Linderina pennispora TaxID=61395 RepID=A0A1Y1VZU3_9FUNG|nr:uncharacterized protein DL89DRAFT_269824 [Linderina pennispora]ORX66781.1 hypothetical protein DL89DRAFT_269824 [Linderina pennispora]